MYQRSLTISIGSSLPIAPAGMVTVVRVPSASTPSMVCGSSAVVCPSPGGTIGGMAILKPAPVLPVHAIVAPAAPTAFTAAGGYAIGAPGGGGPAGPGAPADQRRSVTRVASWRSWSMVTAVPATGSLIVTSACDRCATIGPTTIAWCSRRSRPRPSRAIATLDLRLMRLPSASACVVSVTASAV